MAAERRRFGQPCGVRPPVQSVQSTSCGAAPASICALHLREQAGEPGDRHRHRIVCREPRRHGLLAEKRAQDELADQDVGRRRRVARCVVLRPQRPPEPADVTGGQSGQRPHEDVEHLAGAGTLRVRGQRHGRQEGGDRRLRAQGDLVGRHDDGHPRGMERPLQGGDLAAGAHENRQLAPGHLAPHVGEPQLAGDVRSLRPAVRVRADGHDVVELGSLSGGARRGAGGLGPARRPARAAGACR